MLSNQQWPAFASQHWPALWQACGGSHASPNPPVHDAEFCVHHQLPVFGVPCDFRKWGTAGPHAVLCAGARQRHLHGGAVANWVATTVTSVCSRALHPCGGCAPTAVGSCLEPALWFTSLARSTRSQRPQTSRVALDFYLAARRRSGSKQGKCRCAAGRFVGNKPTCKLGECTVTNAERACTGVALTIYLSRDQTVHTSTLEFGNRCDTHCPPRHATTRARQAAKDWDTQSRDAATWSVPACGHGTHLRDGLWSVSPDK